MKPKLLYQIVFTFVLCGFCFADGQNVEAPTYANIPYGKDGRNVLDFWQAKGEGPRPLVVYIHGGGWEKGDKKSMKNATTFLEKGISVASINYRLLNTDPLPAPVYDAARAVQFLRSKAREWNIDKENVVLAGGSAGGCSSLWIATHDDLANPMAKDPVERESTRVQGVGVLSAQTSIDPEVIEPWIGPNVFLSMIYRAVGEDSVEAMKVNYNKHKALYHEFSPINHLSPDDPPIFLEYLADPEFMAVPATSLNYGIHHGLFGIKFKEKSEDVGHNRVELRIKDHEKSRVEQYSAVNDFLIKILLGNREFVPAPSRPTTVMAEPSSLKKFMPRLLDEQLDAAARGNFDLVMIGDSITHGWKKTHEVFKDIDTLNLGFPGDRTQNVLFRIQKGVLKGVSAKLVTIMLGTNHLHDPKKGYMPDSAADVFTGIQKVVSAVHAQVPDAKIVVFAIFPRGPEATNQRVNEVNELLTSLNNNNLVDVININSVFQNKDGTLRATCYKKDQLHLTPEGYDAWAKKLSQLLISKCALGSLPENSKKILSN